MNQRTSRTKKFKIGVKRLGLILSIAFIPLSLFFLFCLPETLFEKPTSTVLFDVEDNLLSAHIAADGQWRFPHNDSLPYKFKTALIAFEDRHFMTHWGVHLPSIARAMVQNIEAGRVVSGGSTLSMQVIRLSRNNPDRTLFEKFTEMIRAMRLESKFSKDQILAFHASNAPMGGNVVGLDAAAWRYFGRAPTDLTWAESCLLAILPNAPSLIYPGKNQLKLKAKRDRLLRFLYEQGNIDSLTWVMSCQETLPGRPSPLPQIASHAMQFFKNQGHEGKRISSTLREGLQKNAQKVVDHYAKLYAANGIHNVAAIIVKVDTREVVAYIGNTNLAGQDHQGHVDLVQAKRSSGSILKPLLYASMLDEGTLLPQSLVPDVPIYFGGYAPANFHKKHDGMVPAAKALSKSLNVPAVVMLRKHGVAKFKNNLQQLGFSTFTRSANDYGLSLILGGGEVTLWELVSCYSGMSQTLKNYARNNGKYDPTAFDSPTLIAKDKKKAPLSESSPLSAAAISLTFEALLEVNRPGTEVGWEQFSSSQKVAWKTGTSWGGRDAWAVGTTPEYTVGVWVGNADGEGRPGITGATMAAPVMFDLFDRLASADWFDMPYDEMRKVEVCAQSGFLPSPSCQQTSEQWIVDGPIRLEPCPYHRWIQTDKNSGLRVQADCAKMEDIETRSWFVLSPIQEWYYKPSHPEYLSLPALDSRCMPTENRNPMDLIYPRNSGKIYLPLTWDGQRSPAVFEVTHSNPKAVLYWHLDHHYLGSTQTLHKMNIPNLPGKHNLLVVDEWGHRISKSIEILNEK